MKYPLMVAPSFLVVMGASTIGCITPTDLAEDAERGQLSAVRGAWNDAPDRCR